MKRKHVLLSLLIAVIVAACCSAPETQAPHPVMYYDSIELVGYTPKSREERKRFEAILNKYNQPPANGGDPAIFKVTNYTMGGQKIVKGAMEDIGCELEGMITFWVDHGPATGGRMTHTTGITDYAGRIGMTCSTSCGGHLDNSNRMVKEVSDVIGRPPRHHRH